MPRRTDIKSILIIGAGPIVIGQACEFDYAGTQACKALKAEGYRVILVNSNPATIMTDPDLADATYVEPITPEIVARIMEKERPDALLPTMGGQTALNIAMALERDGVLARLGVDMIGAQVDAIARAEDRRLFRTVMDKIGLESPRAEVVRSMEEAWAALETIGLPAIVRPSFTLGGTGGGIARKREEFADIVAHGLDISPAGEVLIEESVLGWKEYEMEVVRDRADNAIIVCSIENLDPMGVHTGDSITVAPALTLTDKEYQRMRDASIAVLRAIGVETGGSNVQFAVNPENGRLLVIEMNPRVSRSSALASKATGFPIAKVAARLAVGYTLDELDNDITGATPASFEPALDYVVTKIPRFAFEKFPGAEDILTTSMKSVGEVMGIGRCFAESLQKALRSLETGLTGLDEVDLPDDPAAALESLAVPTPDRLLKVAQALRQTLKMGLSADRIGAACGYDRWFLDRLQEIVAAEAGLQRDGLPDDAARMESVKSMGFSDARIAHLTGSTQEAVRHARHEMGVRPVFRRVDTCAAEFASQTPYLYAGYESGGICEAAPSDRRKVIILGGGPNRIGQGIEFDYCCCHAAFALKEMGIESIMVNCNPETVSTDYDTSDRLYFEPLTVEDILEIVNVEKQSGELLGLIVQFGGQTPLKLSRALEACGVPILGTSPDAIDLAEDRDRFKALLESMDLRQPEGGIARSAEEAHQTAETIGYPVVIRPSYILGGRAMEIVGDSAMLDRYIREAVVVSGESPVLVDAYLSDAVEVDVDALSDGETVRVAGIMQHIEEAGIHSGDSACAMPPHSLDAAAIAELTRQTSLLARALRVKGLMNIQYAIKDGDIYVLEVNPRASRTVPFVSKVTGRPVAGMAAQVMVGKSLESFAPMPSPGSHVAVKEAIFPFARFPGVDTVLGPEMRSTGEVMGLSDRFETAFAKSQLAGGVNLPDGGVVFISVKGSDKERFVGLAERLHGLGFRLLATSGTAACLRAAGLETGVVNKVQDGSPHVVDAIEGGEVQLVFNTTEGSQSLSDSRSLRRAALLGDIPYYTTYAGAAAAVSGIAVLREGRLEVGSLQHFHAARV